MGKELNSLGLDIIRMKPHKSQLKCMACSVYQPAEQHTRFAWQMANADVFFIESVSQSVNKILLNMIISVRRSNELFKLFLDCCCSNVRMEKHQMYRGRCCRKSKKIVREKVSGDVDCVVSVVQSQ